MTVTPARTLLGAAIALAACVLAWACQSSGGGGDCFPPEHGPSDPSCAGFTPGLTCPVDVTPCFTCTCTQQDAGPEAGPPQSWVCGGVDPTPGACGTMGGGGGSGGAGGSAGTGGKAGSAGSGTDGGM